MFKVNDIELTLTTAEKTSKNIRAYYVASYEFKSHWITLNLCSLTFIIHTMNSLGLSYVFYRIKVISNPSSNFICQLPLREKFAFIFKLPFMYAMYNIQLNQLPYLFTDSYFQWRLSFQFVKLFLRYDEIFAQELVVIDELFINVIVRLMIKCRIQVLIYISIQQRLITS